jgi:tetratricopeptide (TPR) repeat protein/cellulose biosynthesis protein BcsQ
MAQNLLRSRDSHREAPALTQVGKIITFYSYKGGTGRSMALANVACLLAKRSNSNLHRVLMIDWDLEAPGLHTYFRNRLSPEFNENLESAPGLIELFIRLDDAVKNLVTEGIEQDEERASVLIEQLKPEEYILDTGIPSLSLLKAGRFDAFYSKKVNGFKWKEFYERSPWLINAFARYLGQKFNYVLIDSRTGVSDISGICTTLMPEKLVTVFTPNRQSLFGLKKIITEAIKYRSEESQDLRPLAVFPLASRIEPVEPKQGAFWRSGDKEEDIPGYQPTFEGLFEEIYELSTKCDLSDYFRDVQIQHIPFYAYGERIAVLNEHDPDRLSLPKSYETFTTRLTDSTLPWLFQDFEEVDEDADSDLGKQAETAYLRLSPEAQQLAQRVLPRLIRVAQPHAGGLDTRERISINEFASEEKVIIDELAGAGLVNVESKHPKAADRYVELSDEALIYQWERLRKWIDKDVDFLIARQALRTDLNKWEENWRKDNHDLLAGDSLKRAQALSKKREADLNAREKEFLQRSEIHARQQQTWEIVRRVGLYVLAIATLLSVFQIIRQFQKYQGTSDVYLALANSQLEKGNLEDAIRNYNEAIKLNDKSAEAFLYRGQAYEGQKKYPEAVSDYNRALFLKSPYPEASTGLGRVSLQQGNYDEAIANLNLALTSAPNNADAWMGLGEALLRKNNFVAAIEAYKKAVSIRPNSPVASERLGDVLAQNGRYDEAIEAYTNAIRLSPKRATTYLGRGVAYEKSGELILALSDYDLAIKTNLNFSEAYLKKADLLVAMLPARKSNKDLELALSNYAEAIRSNPKSAEAHFKRGHLLQSQGSDQLAIPDFSQAITLTPSYIDAYLYRGISYRKLGQTDNALADFSKAIAIKDDYFPAYYERGVLYQSRNDKASAIEDYKKAQTSTDPQTHEKAKNALKALGIWESTPVSKTTVELHYESSADQELISTIQSSLTNKGYTVHVIRPTGREPSTGIKYFNIEDKQNANEIKGLIESAIKSKSPTFSINVGFFKKYKAQIGTIEVTIPAVSQPTTR